MLFAYTITSNRMNYELCKELFCAPPCTPCSSSLWNGMGTAVAPPSLAHISKAWSIPSPCRLQSLFEQAEEVCMLMWWVKGTAKVLRVNWGASPSTLIQPSHRQQVFM
eukprot:871258-Pelagomonas_calceolata.AAC.2